MDGEVPATDDADADDDDPAFRAEDMDWIAEEAD